MAVIAITLQPSADIHLVLQPPARATLRLDVLSHDDAVVAPSSVRNQCTFNIPATDAIAAVSATGVLSPTMSLEMSWGRAANQLNYELQQESLFKSSNPARSSPSCGPAGTTRPEPIWRWSTAAR